MNKLDGEYSQLEKYIQGRILILAHHNADPDALCSAFCFKALSETLNQEVDARIYMPGGISSLSKSLVAKLEMELVSSAEIDDFDCVFVLDTASFNQLNDWGPIVKTSEKPVVFIDHHAIHPDVKSKADLFIHDEEASSTSEIITKLYRTYRIQPSEQVARALVLGILYDSKHLSLASPLTLRYVADLLEVAGELRFLTKMLSSKITNSEKIARIKAAQRAKTQIVNGWVLATAEVGAFQASAARGLLGLGADVAVVAGIDKRLLKVSMRSTDRFYRESGVHLGRDVSLPLSYEFDGSGSGHPTAAGFNGTGEVTDVLKKSVELISQKIL